MVNSNKEIENINGLRSILIFPKDMTLPQEETIPSQNIETQETSKEATPKDPRGEDLKTEIVELLTSAQSVLKDALDSQIKLAKMTEQFQESINEIKTRTAVASYPAGMRSLQASMSRIQICKKRIAQVGKRMNRIANIIKQQEQQQALIQQKNSEKPNETQPEIPQQPLSQPPQEQKEETNETKEESNETKEESNEQKEEPKVETNEQKNETNEPKEELNEPIVESNEQKEETNEEAEIQAIPSSNNQESQQPNADTPTENHDADQPSDQNQS